MRLSPRFNRNARKIFFFLHLWTGAILGLWFSMVGVTGSLLAWLPELLSTEIKVRYPQDNPGRNAVYIPLSRAIEAMTVAQPDITPKELAQVGLPDTWYPYYMFFRDEKPFPKAMFLVDPYSARVNAPRVATDSYMFKIAHFHSELLLEAKGLAANGIGSAFAVIMLLSGLWLWWPATIHQIKTRLTIKRGASLRRFLLDLHNVMGMYCYIVLFLTTVTAVVLAYNSYTEGGLERVVDGKPVASPAQKPRPESVAFAVPMGAKRLSDDALVEAAKVGLAGASVARVKRPIQSQEPFIAFMKYPGGFYTNARLTLDPYTGTVLKTEKDTNASVGKKTISLSTDLHYGWFGGIGTKLMYTIAGMMLPGLFVTSMLLWWKRKQSENTAKKRRRDKVAAVSAFLLVGAGMTFPSLAQAQEEKSLTPAPFVLNKAQQFELKSKENGRVYRIFLSVPDGPAPPSGYPVLYTSDGNAFFPLITSTANLLRVQNKAVIVGIGYPGEAPFDTARRYYNLTPLTAPEVIAARGGGGGRPKNGADSASPARETGGNEAFFQFIEKELKPAIDARYPIDRKQQALFGHSLGGLFVLHVLFAHPDSFQTYLAAAPSIWWNNQSVLKEEEAFKPSPNSAIRLFLAANQDNSPQAKSNPAAASMTENAHAVFSESRRKA